MKNALALAFMLGVALGIGVGLPACSDDYAGGGCCRKCSTGKPCGDSCIASGKQCNSPPGCACYGNGDETDAGSDAFNESESEA